MRLTDESIARMCDGIEEGLPRKHAAALAGLDWGSVKRWLSEGSEDIKTLAEGHSLTTDLQEMRAKLVSSVEMAEAVHSKIQLGLIGEDATAAVRLKMLQLRYPELYGEVRRAEVRIATAETQATLEEAMQQLGIPYE